MSDPVWLQLAKTFDGTKANGGHPSNPVILGWAQYIGQSGYNSDTIAWCGLFMSYIMKRNGFQIPTYPLSARAWATFGIPLEKPAVGAVMVFSRGAPADGHGHVTLYTGEDDTHYFCFGGNQKSHVACLSARKKTGLLAIRWPNGNAVPTQGPTVLNVPNAAAPDPPSPTSKYPDRDWGPRIPLHVPQVVRVQKYDGSPQGYHWVGQQPDAIVPISSGGGFATARVGDICTHGAKIITSCATRYVGDHLVARVGDLIDCPLHGINKIIGPIEVNLTENNSTARKLSYAECGAQVMTVYNDNGSGGTAVSVDRFGNVIVLDQTDLANESDDAPPGTPASYAVYPKATSLPLTPQQAQQNLTLGVQADPTKPSDTTPPANPPAAVPTSCQDIPDNASDSFQLSSNFTLGDVSSKAACASGAGAASGPVVANLGKSRQQIICNLRNLCVNCLEPLATHYGRKNVVINSGFRRNSDTSQHNIGEAADIRIIGHTGDAMLQVAEWVRDNLPYYQLLIECKSANGPWVHIGYNAGAAAQGKRHPTLPVGTAVFYSGNPTYVPGLRLP